MSKKLITAAAAATLGAMALSTTAFAGVSATGGFTSEYIFRGLPSGPAAAFASVDWANDSGLAVGVWAIDQADGQAEGDGQEFDVYASYTFEASDDLSLSLGYTSYQYTADKGSFGEVNLGVAFNKFSLAVDLGSSDDGDGMSAIAGDDIDSQHIAVSYAHNDYWTFTLGQTDPNTDDDLGGEDDGWMYLDATVAGEVSDVDVAMSAGFVDEEDLVEFNTGSTMSGYITLTVSKTFDGLGL